MGIETNKSGHRFGLRELGVLDGPPLRGADTVVQTVHDLFAVRRAVFLVFDDTAGCARVRISSGLKVLADVPLADSLSEWIRSENTSCRIASVADIAPEAPERRSLDAGAFLGAPVHGPNKDVIGVLAAVHPSPHDWNKLDDKRLENLAHLISQEIMLRASFETLRLISAERVRPSLA